MSPRVLPCLAFAVALLAATPARADGANGQFLSAGLEGVTVPGASTRFVTTYAGGNTMLLRLLREGGQVSGYRELDGNMTVPAVAMDGTPGGLSSSGNRLVLFKPPRSFPVGRSHFALVDTDSLKVDRFSLRGQWSFDAISPDGASVYLTEYPYALAPDRYALRRYDVKRRRVVGGAIVDRREPDEEMGGMPVARASSPHGRWAYTLYTGTGHGKPFIHALDTVRARAFCIDLDDLDGHPALDTLRLYSAPDRVLVYDKNEPLATVDTRTLRVQPASAWWGVVWR